ncbi:MAG: pseudouridine synthase, partial [Kofleriaceae bacterium]|nr:pseudouridine synthase [Kofleriaceae bacterium]
MGELVRLQRYLAAAGVAARRKAEDLITAGRVTVNGDVVTILGTKIDPDVDQVHVDGEAVVALDAFYVLLNKPKACITAVTDDRGRPTVMDYLPNLPVPVKPVGRLDFYSEGVLLLTNDGELAARLLAPASHVPKTYHVKVHGQLSPEDLKRLRNGVQLDDGTETLPAEVELLPGESKHSWVAITIHEGKHRQIHRMIEALGYRVDKLQRVAFANLTFHNLRIGDARELTQQELNELRDAVGLDHSKVARGKWRSDREQTDIPRRARAKARAEAEEAQAELEARQAANAARRAARAAGEEGDLGGDAWDGEGDADRDSDEVHHTGIGFEDRDAAGRGYESENDESGEIHHTGIGFEDRDAIGRAREQRGGRGGGPRGGAGGRGGAGPRGVRGAGPRDAGARGGRDERGAGPRGGRDERGAGLRGGRDARGAGPRGAGPRGAGPLGGRVERGAGPRGAGPRGGRDERGAGPRGA